MIFAAAIRHLHFPTVFRMSQKIELQYSMLISCVCEMMNDFKQMPINESVNGT